MYDNSRAEEVLGMRFRTLKESVVDTVKCWCLNERRLYLAPIFLKGFLSSEAERSKCSQGAIFNETTKLIVVPILFLSNVPNLTPP